MDSAKNSKELGFEDLWMLLLLRELGEFAYVPERLTLYRVGENGKLSTSTRPPAHLHCSGKRALRPKRQRLIRGAKNSQCRSLLSKTAHRMNNGDRLGALRILARIARCRPAFFFTSEFRGRLFLPQNMKRLRDLVSMLTRPSQDGRKIPVPEEA